MRNADLVTKQDLKALEERFDVKLDQAVDVLEQKIERLDHKIDRTRIELTAHIDRRIDEMLQALAKVLPSIHPLK